MVLDCSFWFIYTLFRVGWPQNFETTTCYNHTVSRVTVVSAGFLVIYIYFLVNGKTDTKRYLTQAVRPVPLLLIIYMSAVSIFTKWFLVILLNK